jgi:6-phosphogluconolactonase
MFIRCRRTFPDAATAAAEYETTVETYFAGSSPVFDVVLLGIGEDGHVASVFSDSPAISSAQMAIAVTVPADPPIRLTLTLPMLSGARYVGVVATGARKARALAHAFAGEFDTPAAILARTAPEAVWWTDRAAMGTGGDGVPR